MGYWQYFFADQKYGSIVIVITLQTTTRNYNFLKFCAQIDFKKIQ